MILPEWSGRRGYQRLRLAIGKGLQNVLLTRPGYERTERAQTIMNTEFGASVVMAMSVNAKA